MLPTLQLFGILALSQSITTTYSSSSNKRYPPFEQHFTPVMTFSANDSRSQNGYTKHSLTEMQVPSTVTSTMNQSISKGNQWNSNYNRQPAKALQYSNSTTIQTNPKENPAKNNSNKVPSQKQQTPSSMTNQTQIKNNRGNNMYAMFHDMMPKFPPIMSSMMNHTNSKDKRKKSGRIFSFSDKDNEISVELGFTIPFITIPIKGMNDDDKKPLVNINVGAIAAGTILTTAALIFIPKAFSGLEPEISIGKSSSGEKRSFLSRMDRALMDHNIDTSVCTQRAVCWIVKSAASKVTVGEGGSMDKIIDGIASNALLERLVEGTAIQDAIHNGRKNKDCSILYSKCPITQDALQRIAHNFMTGIV